MPTPGLLTPAPCRCGVWPHSLGPAWSLSPPQPAMALRPAPWSWRPKPKSLGRCSRSHDTSPGAPTVSQTPGSSKAEVSWTPALEHPAYVGIAAVSRASGVASPGVWLRARTVKLCPALGETTWKQLWVVLEEGPKRRYISCKSLKAPELLWVSLSCTL